MKGGNFSENKITIKAKKPTQDLHEFEGSIHIDKIDEPILAGPK